MFIFVSFFLISHQIKFYTLTSSLRDPSGILSWWGTEECTVVMATQSQTSSAAEKKKRVETIVATKSVPTRAEISEKAVASSTTSNGTTSTFKPLFSSDYLSSLNFYSLLILCV